MVIYVVSVSDGMDERMRLDKLMSETGTATRTEAKRYIAGGRVTVNGIVAGRPEQKVDETLDEVCLDGRKIVYSRFVYYMMNKPAGIITATEDRREKTVLDLLPAEYRRKGLFPVGRLDRDTEGLLILTDDGELAHELLSPTKHVDKEYFVRVNGELDEGMVNLFEAGFHVDASLDAMPSELKIITSGAQSEAIVTIREGKFHQIKRMFHATNREVLYLKRISMGGVKLDENLKPGMVRPLTDGEINCLLSNELVY